MYKGKHDPVPEVQQKSNHGFFKIFFAVFLTIACLVGVMLLVDSYEIVRSGPAIMEVKADEPAVTPTPEKEKGSASEESTTIPQVNTQPANTEKQYDLPPQVTNGTNYFDVQWNDYLKHSLENPCGEFEIVNCDPKNIVSVKVLSTFKYKDLKYSRWFTFDEGAVLRLTPGRYFFPKDCVEIYGEKIVLGENEDPVKRCQVEIYNLDRLMFTKQAILKSWMVYETYFADPLFFPSKGW